MSGVVLNFGFIFCLYMYIYFMYYPETNSVMRFSDTIYSILIYTLNALILVGVGLPVCTTHGLVPVSLVMMDAVNDAEDVAHVGSVH